MNQDLYNAIRNAFDNAQQSVTRHHLPHHIENIMDRFRWLLACGKIICPEYRFKWPQLDWWRDEHFSAYLEHFDEHQGMNSDRRWNLLQFLGASIHIQGDTAECGCYKGASSYIICDSNKKSVYNRMHHVFDSFCGLSEPSDHDGDHWKKHSLVALEEEFEENMCIFSGKYIVHKGWIPERFSDVADLRFSFVHIDVDLHQPTFDSIDFFYPRLNSGGIIVCDDYGFSTCPGATKAIKTFMRDKPEPIIQLASGGCVIIRQSSFRSDPNASEHRQQP